MRRDRARGNATLVRYADDFVMTFETHPDAKRVLEVLAKLLGRFGLTPHPDKTRFVDSVHRAAWYAPRLQDPPFDSLGSTYAWRESRSGRNVVRQMATKSRFARELIAIENGCACVP